MSQEKRNFGLQKQKATQAAAKEFHCVRRLKTGKILPTNRRSGGNPEN